MTQVEETVPPTSVNLNGLSLKMEVIEQNFPINNDDNHRDGIGSIETPSSTTSCSKSINNPPPTTNSTLSTAKRIKRKLRVPMNIKKTRPVSSKPVTLLARPSTTNLSTILPHPTKPVIVSSPIAPIIPNTIATMPSNTAQPFTTYLVVDGNQGQFVQVANDGKQPVTFRNQTGQILQATPINVVSATNSTTPSISSFPITSDCSLLSNSSQTVTTVRTSSSIDMQQKTMLTSDTTTTTTQQMTGILHQPTILPSGSILSTTVVNGSNAGRYDGTTLEVARASDSDLSLSLSELSEKVNQRHRRLSSSSYSKKRRGRPRLYERDPFSNATKNDNNIIERTEITLPSPTPQTFIFPVASATVNNMPQPSSNFISPIVSSINTNSAPTMNGSLLQQHSYNYPSLLSNKPPCTTLLNSSNINMLQNSTNTPPTIFSSVTPSLTNNSPYFLSPTISLSEPAGLAPLKNLQIVNSQPVNSQNGMTRLSTSNISPKRSSNPDTATHFIGGYIIRESSQPFTIADDFEQKNKSNLNFEQQPSYSQCVICQTVNLSARFYDLKRLACTKICSLTLYEQSLLNEAQTTVSASDNSIENRNPIKNHSPQTEEQVAVPPNHGLPTDPSKWTVSQVGEFIGRLTNPNIRDAFHESEIDGQALLLMTPEHLRETLKIKLGPSLIIASEIAKLRDRDKK